MIKAVDHRQPRARPVRVPRRCSSARCSAGCSSATGRTAPGKFGLLQPIADLVKLVRKEAFAPSSAIELPVHPRAGRLRVHGARRVRVIPFGPGLDASTASRSNGEVANVPIALLLDLRARLDRHLRLHRRRLGIRVEVLAARLDAHVRAARLVRGVARARACSASSCSAARSRSSTSSTAQGDVLRSSSRSSSACSSSSSPASPRRRAPPFDLPEAEHGARRRLPHRVLGHALGALPDGRVHQPDHALRRCCVTLFFGGWHSRGCTRSTARADLVPAQALGVLVSSSSGCARRCRACATTS